MIIAYHFTDDTLRDGRPIPAIGEPLVHSGLLILCESGLHASIHPFDALKYAPGHMLHKVECCGVGDSDEDKLVCRKRTIIATINAEHLLRRFAADQALSVAHLRSPHPIVDKYLRTLDPKLRDAARDYAWGAALDAAQHAARGAAWGAAWGAALDAARAEFAKRVKEAFGD